MYLKRNNIGKFWPIKRKGTKYLSVSTHNQNESIPIAVVLRDITNTVRNKKELKKAMIEELIQINHRTIREPNYPVSLFDVITLVGTDKNYRATLSKHKKFVFEEISEKEAQTKVYKVMSKKLLSGKKIQLNLLYGRNINSDEKVNSGDSVVVDLKSKKIIDTIKLEKGKLAFVMKGKHAGYSGVIDEIVVRGSKSIAKIKSDEGKINVWIKNILIIK